MLWIESIGNNRPPSDVYVRIVLSARVDVSVWKAIIAWAIIALAIIAWAVIALDIITRGIVSILIGS